MASFDVDCMQVIRLILYLLRFILNKETMVLPACNPHQGVPVWQLGIDRLLHRNLVTQSLERLDERRL